MTEVIKEGNYFVTTADDGISPWRKVYEAVKLHPINTFFSYFELSNIIGENIKDDRHSLYEANKHLLEDCNLMLLCIRGKGYKIAKATEQLQHASTRPKRAKRQIKKGIREAEHTDQKGLTVHQKQYRLDLINHMQDGLRMLRKRQNKAIKIQKLAHEGISTIEDDLKKLKKELNK